MTARCKRILWLEKQMDIQQNALVNAKSVDSSRIHAYLLEKVTDEWVALNNEVTQKELHDMACELGY